MIASRTRRIEGSASSNPRNSGCAIVETNDAEVRQGHLGRPLLPREVSHDEAGNERTFRVLASPPHEQSFALGVESQHVGVLDERLREANVEAVEQGCELALKPSSLSGRPAAKSRVLAQAFSNQPPVRIGAKSSHVDQVQFTLIRLSDLFGGAGLFVSRSGVGEGNCAVARGFSE